MSIVITGATGNIGSALVRHLVAAGADVTLLVRNPDKVDPAVRGRVKIEQGVLEDQEFVQRSTAGAEALFWLTPPNFHLDDVVGYYTQSAKVAVNAVQANRIPYVVHISSAGAQKPDAGLVTAVGHTERALDATEANVVHLRAGFFMENYLQQLDAIRNMNSVFFPAPPEAVFPLIATRDIAAAAAPYLLERNWAGKQIRGLHGPADVALGEAAKILSEATGHPIQHVQVTPEQTRQTLLGMGASPAFADGYLEMSASLMQPGSVAEPRTPETTTPTTLYQWATEVLKPLL